MGKLPAKQNQYVQYAELDKDSKPIIGLGDVVRVDEDYGFVIDDNVLVMGEKITSSVVNADAEANIGALKALNGEIEGDLSVGGRLEVTDEINTSALVDVGRLHVDTHGQLEGNLNVKGDLNVGNSDTESGYIRIKGKNADGYSLMADYNVDLDSLFVQGNLTVYGDTSLEDNVTIEGTLRETQAFRYNSHGYDYIDVTISNFENYFDVYRDGNYLSAKPNIDFINHLINLRISYNDLVGKYGSGISEDIDFGCILYSAPYADMNTAITEMNISDIHFRTVAHNVYPFEVVITLKSTSPDTKCDIIFYRHYITGPVDY